MARITTTGSIRTTVTTATFAVAATLALAACGSSADTSLASAAKSAAPSSSQASDAAPKANPKAKVEKKVEKVAVQRPATQSTTSPRSARTGTKKSADLEYVKIVEPFGTPGRCDPAGTTIEMTACILKKVVDVDYTVDALQAQRSRYGTSANEGERDLRDDAQWLAKRTKTCSAHPSGGTIDQITQAQCLLKVSKARVRSLS